MHTPRISRGTTERTLWWWATAAPALRLPSAPLMPGARVLVLESMAEGGGNTRVSMGGFLCPDDSRAAVTYISALYELSHSDKDESVIRAFVSEAVHNVQWIEGLKLGTKTHVYGHAGYPEVPGADSIKKYLVKGKGRGMTTFARNLWRVLTFAVEEKTADSRVDRNPCQTPGH